MPDYRRAIYRPSNPETFDGNGKIHPIEEKQGIKVIPDKNGNGFRKVGNLKASKLLATVEDSSATKHINKMDEIEKRQDKTDKKIDDIMAMMKEILKRDKGEGDK